MPNRFYSDHIDRYRSLVFGFSFNPNKMESQPLHLIRHSNNVHARRDDSLPVHRVIPIPDLNLEHGWQDYIKLKPDPSTLLRPISCSVKGKLVLRG